MNEHEKYKVPLPSGQRYKIYLRDGFKCLKCGCDDPAQLTIDHIVPLSRGGSNKYSNKQTLCKKCNGQKGDRVKDYRRKEHRKPLETASPLKKIKPVIKSVHKTPMDFLQGDNTPAIKSIRMAGCIGEPVNLIVEYEQQSLYNDTREIK